ncbi:hypothetical protein AB0B45_11545 [Nonomuraea sp. NPDC049152]|uniref:hypothetical protein n=1 Tax=Nonomuraea sp. NPDC049152 TaxID=3154350 RepID=UPI0033F9660E
MQRLVPLEHAAAHPQLQQRQAHHERLEPRGQTGRHEPEPILLAGLPEDHRLARVEVEPGQQLAVQHGAEPRPAHQRALARHRHLRVEHRSGSTAAKAAAVAGTPSRLAIIAVVFLAASTVPAAGGPLCTITRLNSPAAAAARPSTVMLRIVDVMYALLYIRHVSFL